MLNDKALDYDHDYGGRDKQRNDDEITVVTVIELSNCHLSWLAEEAVPDGVDV